MSKAHDLTGAWDGIFNYPRGMSPNAFQATLRQSGTALVGETREASDSRRDRGKTLHGWIEGDCLAGAVRFVKSYDDPARAHYAVTYAGSANGDGTEITGTWTIPGNWSGTFIMVRRLDRGADIEQRVADTVR